jgi:hypothetical protein
MSLLLAALITGVVGPLLLAWYTRRELKSRVGTPNGQGSLVQMAEAILAGQATQDERLGRLEGSTAALEGRVVVLERHGGQGVLPLRASPAASTRA